MKGTKALDLSTFREAFRKSERARKTLRRRLSRALAKAEQQLRDLKVHVVHHSVNLKEEESVLRKVLGEGEYARLEDLPDLVRGRLVLLSLQDVALAARFLRHTIWNRPPDVECFSVKDYYTKPKGVYRSVHLAVQFRGAKFICEVQVRTLLDDAWAEWEHQVKYKVAGASLSAVEEDFARDIGLHFQDLAIKTDDLRETVNDRRALVAAAALDSLIRPVTDLPRVDEVRNLVNRVAEETDLQFVTLQGCTEGQVHTNLRPDPERHGIEPGWKSGSDLVWRSNHAKLGSLRPLFQRYLEACVQHNDKQRRAKKQHFDDDTCAKVTGWRTSADVDALAIDLIKTSYYTYNCTNRLLARTPAVRKPTNKIVRISEKIADELRDIQGTPFLDELLADPLGMHVVLIGRHKEGTGILVTRRSFTAVAEQWGEWNSSAAGYVLPEQSTMLTSGDIPGFSFMANRDRGKRRPVPYRAEGALGGTGG